MGLGGFTDTGHLLTVTRLEPRMRQRQLQTNTEQTTKTSGN